MYVVAVVESRVGVEADEEVGHILGVTPLEARMALAATPPHIVLRTPSRERADQAARELCARGLAAMAVDLAEVVPVEQMVHVHRFSLEPAGVRIDDRGVMLAFDDIGALVRVAASTSVLRTTRETLVDPIPGRGLERREDHTYAERTLEHALFLFPRTSGAAPWVIRATEARYLALGAAMRPSSMENFLLLVSLLRERMPQTPYDDRFVARPIARTAQVQVRGHDSATPVLGDEGLEVTVQLLARWLTRPRGGPYRDE